ncbi:hypothetical protein M1614_01570 [Candidatus Marsarchaeota archaeon]|jgi:hypothetical protein|nr:hypothetical protein [Candidatus Marsarchaeota archaeon]MCL5089720.1 hypothetical protein [Candidatus Marsarchaeota archaeon]
MVAIFYYSKHNDIIERFLNIDIEILTMVKLETQQKEKDEIWALRKALSRPNFAVMDLLLKKSPRTTREIYLILEKKFTRKTLILTLRELSLELNIIQPTHLRTEKGYGLGYKLNPKMKEVVKSIYKLSKIIDGVIKE